MMTTVTILAAPSTSSIAALRMVFEISERFMPVRLIGRGNGFFIEIDNPFVFIGIDRRLPCQGQPHQAARPLRPNAVAASKEQLTEQSLRLDMPLIGSERKPPQ